MGIALAIYEPGAKSITLRQEITPTFGVNIFFWENPTIPRLPVWLWSERTSNGADSIKIWQAMHLLIQSSLPTASLYHVTKKCQEYSSLVVTSSPFFPLDSAYASNEHKQWVFNRENNKCLGYSHFLMKLFEGKKGGCNSEATAFKSWQSNAKL